MLGCNGSGTTSGVIKGVDWVTGNAKKPAIANMSLGGGASTALDDAVKKSADSGVFYALAAGNDGADACTKSPARAGAHDGVTTTAATDSFDIRNLLEQLRELRGYLGTRREYSFDEAEW